jgi:RNA polymerase sigma-70 factor (ECF subfamily)
MGGAPEELDFDAVYRAHVDRVARWAARLGGPTIDAQDVVQDVFVVVHRELGKFRGEAKLTTWLYEITAKQVRHRRRTDRRRRWLRGLFGASLSQSAWQPRAPIRVVADRQLTTLVYRVLDSLSDRDRTLLILFDVEGHSGEEIAEMIGAKLPSVWVRLHRARKRFRAVVQALPPEEQQILLALEEGAGS